MDLDVVGSLDKVGSGDGSIGNESGISVVLMYEWLSERSGCDVKGVEMIIKNQSGKQDRVGPSNIDPNRHSTPPRPRSDHKINNSPSIVPWLCAVSNNDWFS